MKDRNRSGKSGSDEQTPFGLINEEAFARVILYLNIKDYVNLSSLNSKLVKSFGSNNYYWAHVCQAATESTSKVSARIPLSLPKLISKMNPGKKLAINGKSLHEYDFLNVSDKNVAKNFNFKEVIVKYFLRWVHFPKLETQCELFSKKTNALLIIQVADYTEKWDKFWTRRDPKTSRCATDYCYVVDFQVDPQRLETLKTELRGKKLPEEMNGRLVLYARSNVQPREDKFKSPLNMYESFMRKEDSNSQLPNQGASNNSNGTSGTESPGVDLVFSPRATDPTTIGSKRFTTDSSASNSPATGSPITPSTPTGTTPGTPTATPGTPESLIKKDSLHRLRTPSNWSSSRPLKSGSFNLGTPSTSSSEEPSPALTNSTGGQVETPKKAPESAPKLTITEVLPKTVPDPQKQPELQPSNVVIEAPQVVVEQPVEVVEPPQVIIDEPQGTVDEPQVVVNEPTNLFDEPQVVVQPPEVVVDEPPVEAVDPTVPVATSIVEQDPVEHVDVQGSEMSSNEGIEISPPVVATSGLEHQPTKPESTQQVVAANQNIAAQTEPPRRNSRHVDFSDPDMAMDSTVAPSFLMQQHLMNNSWGNASNAQNASAQPESPLKTGERPASVEIKPVERRTSVSDMPQFKRYTVQAGESALPKQPARFAAKANTSASNSPQGSPKLGARHPAVIPETFELHGKVEVQSEQPQGRNGNNDEVLVEPTEDPELPETTPEKPIEQPPSVESTTPEINLGSESGPEATAASEVETDIEPPVQVEAVRTLPTAPLSGPPKSQPPRPPSTSLTDRPNIQPPQLLAVAKWPQGLAQPPKIAPKQPPKTPLEQPITRPLVQPPQPSTALNQPPKQQPPQPKFGGQLRPQPPKPQVQLTKWEDKPPVTPVSTRTPSNPPPLEPITQSIPQPVPQSISQPVVTRPLVPPQQQPAPPQEDDDRFAEPLMETFRPLPPKPWKAIGVRKADDV